jgi:hypothetical protein
MNMLKTHTIHTQQSETFLVYWTNSPIRPGGLLKVRVQPTMEDPQIAAELAAMKFLLEEKRVIGTNLVGNPNTRLIVSQGAIRKLLLKKSDKSHLSPYANFLTTRFAGCQLTVEKDTRWFDGFSPDSIEDMLVREPRREMVKVTGIGDVSVTQHVLVRYAEHFLPETTKDKVTPLAWKKVIEAASDPLLREVSRHSLWKAVKYARQSKQEGRYFLNARRNLVLVVTDNPGQGKRLVTAYPANGKFTQLAKAA